MYLYSLCINIVVMCEQTNSHTNKKQSGMCNTDDGEGSQDSQLKWSFLKKDMKEDKDAVNKEINNPFCKNKQNPV